MHELGDDRMLLDLVLFLDSDDLFVQVSIYDSDQSILLDHLLIDKGSEGQFDFLDCQQVGAASLAFRAVCGVASGRSVRILLSAHDSALGEDVILAHFCTHPFISTLILLFIGCASNLISGRV